MAGMGVHRPVLNEFAPIAAIWDRIAHRYGIEQDSDWEGLRAGWRQMEMLSSALLKGPELLCPKCSGITVEHTIRRMTELIEENRILRERIAETET